MLSRSLWCGGFQFIPQPEAIPPPPRPRQQPESHSPAGALRGLWARVIGVWPGEVRGERGPPAEARHLSWLVALGGLCRGLGTQRARRGPGVATGGSPCWCRLVATGTPLSARVAGRRRALPAERGHVGAHADAAAEGIRPHHRAAGHGPRWRVQRGLQGGGPGLGWGGDSTSGGCPGA